MSKKSILFGGLLITLMLLVSVNVTYAGTPVPTPTRTHTATPARTPTPSPTPTPATQPSCLDLKDTNKSYGQGGKDLSGNLCLGDNQWKLPDGSIRKGSTTITVQTQPFKVTIWNYIGIGAFVALVILLFAWGSRWGPFKPKPKPRPAEKPSIPVVTVKVKLKILSNAQILGLFLVAGILWSTVASLNALFDSAKEAGIAWEKAVEATNQASDRAIPSLSRDGLLVVFWEVFLKPAIKFSPVFGEAFGLILTFVGTGASFVLGKTYHYSWVGTKWVFTNILKPFGRGILWCLGFLGAVIATLLGFKTKQP